MKDWDPGETTRSSFRHQDWCQRMKGYTARDPELSDLPFTFIKGLCFVYNLSDSELALTGGCCC